jgi:hypothetical protein
MHDVFSENRGNRTDDHTPCAPENVDRLYNPATARAHMSLTPPTTTTTPPSPPRPVFDSGGEVPPEYDVFCEGCGYSLVGIVADRCPECGRTYDPNDLPFARVPWLHRRRIGRWRAYWATVRMILFHPRRFAHELCRPVRISAADARLFRRVTLRIALLSMLATVLGVVGMVEAQSISQLSIEEAIAPVLMLTFFTLAFAVFLALATDMPLFIWKGLPSRPPNELAPVHHYAAAPLALTPLVAVVWIGAVAAGRIVSGDEIEFLGELAIAIALIALVLSVWVVPLVLMRSATGCRAARVIALAVYLPVHWALMAIMSGLGFAVVIGLLREFLPGFG